jgi:zinc transporter 9
MLLLEHGLSTHAHDDNAYQLTSARRIVDDVFDVSDAESAVPSRPGTPGGGRRGEGAAASAAVKAWPLTLGLCVHGLADGLALGVSALSSSEAGTEHAQDLSLVVFLALAIHKGKHADFNTYAAFLTLPNI